MLRIGWPPKGETGQKQGADDLLARGASVEELVGYTQPFTGYEVTSDKWPVLGVEAFYGLSGKVVRQILPHTESDAAALLFTLLVYLGCMIGRGAHFTVEGDRHYLKINAVLVGETSKGRKGTSQGRIDELMFKVNPSFIAENTATGLSSGEGLIEHVRDARYKVKEDGTSEMIDPGVTDKRLLVTEPEFASPLTIMRREGNTLSHAIRNAYDDKSLRTLTRNNPLKSTGSHIAILGHITRRELLKHLTEEKLGAGVGNRFLFAVVHRSKTLPHGGKLNPVMPSVVEELKDAVRFGSLAQDIPLGVQDDPEHGISARELWEEIYPDLSEGAEGLFGAVTSRAEAYVRRIATLYAVLDKSEVVTVDHLSAGVAVWQYAEDSARYIFGDLRGEPIADTILEELRAQAPDGLTKSEISGLFNRNVSAKRINAAIKDLEASGLILSEQEEHEGAGRKRTVFYAAE